MADPAKLTHKQKRFAELVAAGIRPTEALRVMGYKGSRPDVAACKMMAKPDVREYVAELDHDAMRMAGITRGMIVAELARIGFADPRNLLTPEGVVKDIDEWDNDTARAVAGLDIEELWEGRGEERKSIGTVRKIKFWNKREALTELAVIAGLKREQVAAGNVGPGLTVIVQQATQVNGTQVVSANRVEVQLPGPT